MTNIAYSKQIVTTIRDTIHSLITSYFSSTLGKETDIVNVVNALVHLESRFNVNATGVDNSTRRGTAGYNYITSSAVSSKLATATPIQEANIYKGLRAIGLMQVVGWNFIKGGALTGVCEIQRLRPELATRILVNPGDDPYETMLGEENIENAILAGLIVLEGKYKSIFPSGDVFKARGDPYNRDFSTKLSGAVSAYLGLGKADALGTRPEDYAASIIGGRSYSIANGTNPIKISTTSPNTQSASAGPSTNGSDKTRLKVPGC
jgi:hypothetical protein